MRLCFGCRGQLNQRGRSETKVGGRRRNGAAGVGIRIPFKVQSFKSSIDGIRRLLMAIPFRADNVGSLLRPAELLEVRAALCAGHVDEKQVREIEERSILS